MGFTLSDSDRALIQTLIREEAQRRRNPTNRPHFETDIQTPDIYVAKTVSGIPALVDHGVHTTGTGTGTGVQPGTNDCDIYRVDFNSTGSPRLHAVGFSIPVYNLSNQDMPGDSWILVERDKWGIWWLSGGSSSAESEIPRHATVITSTPTTGNRYAALIREENGNPGPNDWPVFAQCWLFPLNKYPLNIGETYPVSKWNENKFSSLLQGATRADCCVGTGTGPSGGCSCQHFLDLSGANPLTAQVCFVSGTDVTNGAYIYTQAVTKDAGTNIAILGALGSSGIPLAAIIARLTLTCDSTLCPSGYTLTFGTNPSPGGSIQLQLAGGNNPATTLPAHGTNDGTTVSFCTSATSCNPFCLSVQFVMGSYSFPDNNLVAQGVYQLSIFDTGTSCGAISCGSGSGSSGGCISVSCSPSTVPASFGGTFAVDSGSCSPSPNGQTTTVNFLGLDGAGDPVWSASGYRNLLGYTWVISISCASGVWAIFIDIDVTTGTQSFNGTITNTSGTIWTINIPSITIGSCVFEFNATFDTSTCP